MEIKKCRIKLQIIQRKSKIIKNAKNKILILNIINTLKIINSIYKEGLKIKKILIDSRL